MVQKRKDGAIDLSDGSVNIWILPLAANRSRRAGLDHIGFRRGHCGPDPQGGSAGATKAHDHYEEKFKGPEGIIVDVGRRPRGAAGKRYRVRREAMEPSPRARLPAINNTGVRS
jgi:hypothetical protein